MQFEKAVEHVKKEFEILRNAFKLVTSTEGIVQVLAIAEGKATQQLAAALPGVMNLNEDAVGMVMRYESGGSLASALYPRSTTGTQAQQSLASTDKLYILKSIAAAIEELHSVGIIHGDLKPENILLSEPLLLHSQPAIRIADFGISHDRSQFFSSTTPLSSTFMKTDASSFEGTLLYAAPEMMRDPDDDSDEEDDNNKVYQASIRTDIYAFGLIIWEVMCRTRPYSHILQSRRQNQIESRLIKAVKSGERPNLDALPTDFPLPVREELKRLIESCWNPDRNLRPTAHTCYKVLEQTHSLLSGQTYDIFFSYRWTHQKVGLHVVKLLQAYGYRVWIDKNCMSRDMRTSVIEGVQNSSVFLCFLSKSYQDSSACMFELEEAKKKSKPIVVVVVDENSLDWANQIVKSAVDLAGYKYTDISSLTSDPFWADKTADTLVPDALDEAVSKKWTDLVSLLDTYCEPSLAKMQPVCTTISMSVLSSKGMGSPLQQQQHQQSQQNFVKNRHVPPVAYSSLDRRE
jgi:serine/threonine protein kinase